MSLKQYLPASRENALVIVFFIGVFIHFLGPITDIDFPFHLKTGEYIVQHREIPEDDPFTFYGQGMVDDRERFMLAQYWLSQVVFYGLFTSFGPAGVIVMRAAVFTLFLFIAWHAQRRRGAFVPLFIIALLVTTLIPFRLDRPQLFSFLGAIILVACIERFRHDQNRLVPLMAVPPLMLLWANLHGGFIFGIAILIGYALAETLKYFLNKARPGLPIGRHLPGRPLLTLLSALLLGVLFSYINPVTSGQLVATIESYTTTKWLYSGVREYMSPLEDTRFPYRALLSNASFWVLFGFLTILLLLSVVRQRSIDLTVLGLFLMSSVAALTSMRYIPFFIAVALPLSGAWRFFPDNYLSQRASRLRLFYPAVFLLVIAVTGLGIYMYRSSFYIQYHRFYPARAAEFLLKHRIGGNMFNSSNKGSFLIWKLYPHYKVFHDTRHINLNATVDGTSISHARTGYYQPIDVALGEALSALVPPELGKIDVTSPQAAPVSSDVTPLWKSLLDRHRIDLIVHEATNDYNRSMFPLTLRLLKDDDWALVYLDGNMLIFVRNAPKYAEFIRQAGKPKDLIYDEIIREAAPLVKQRIGFSGPYASLAFALLMRDKDEDAKKMVAAALEIDSKDLVANFCNAYLELKERHRSKLAGESTAAHVRAATQ